MAVDAIAEEENEDSDNPDSVPEKHDSVPEKHDDDSKPTDRKLFKTPSHDATPITSPTSPSYMWRIDLTKTEPVNYIFIIFTFTSF